MDIEIHAAGGDDFEMGEADAERKFVGSPAAYILLFYLFMITLLASFGYFEPIIWVLFHLYIICRVRGADEGQSYGQKGPWICR